LSPDLAAGFTLHYGVRFIYLLDILGCLEAHPLNVSQTAPIHDYDAL
jgi:hypothetical protein